jgi:low affinity Fe/Cu permease
VTLLTAALLLMIAGNLGTLLLYLREHRQQREALPSDGQMSESLARMEAKLDTLIRRISEVKTRLADEEKQDQQEKARARYQAKKQGA